jgi:2-keto-4-pentenoate hydratase/2-oxohepta-3-ene-1,7-dioic acid hydratase in catechol pathway
MILDVGSLLASLAAPMALEPGDILATGRPSWARAASGAYLKIGDVVEAESDGLGSLSNPRVAPGPPW